MVVLVADIGQLVSHLSFKEKVAQISFLEEPAIKLAKSLFAVEERSWLFWKGSDEIWEMTGSCD